MQRLVEPCVGPEPSEYFSGKALGPRRLFFLFFGNYGALCENKGIWILFRKNVTYKQIALENLCLTLSAWVRHREHRALLLLSSRRPPPFSSSVCCLWPPKGPHLLSRLLPSLMLRAQVFSSALALPGMCFPFLSASPSSVFKIQFPHRPPVLISPR